MDSRQWYIRTFTFCFALSLCNLLISLRASIRETPYVALFSTGVRDLERRDVQLNTSSISRQTTTLLTEDDIGNVTFKPYNKSSVRRRIKSTDLSNSTRNITQNHTSYHNVKKLKPVLSNRTIDKEASLLAFGIQNVSYQNDKASNVSRSQTPVNGTLLVRDGETKNKTATKEKPKKKRVVRIVRKVVRRKKRKTPSGPDTFLHDDTYTKSKCPSALRRNPKTLPPGINFIRDIPVLMWDQHVTREEHGRLRQYYAPYGWRGVHLDVIQSCSRHLNTSAHRYLFAGWRPDHDSCIRCAVVGNGGILRGSGKGREIDGHDFVFRTNAAITKGFEEDVGNRTSFYFHTILTMKGSLNKTREFGFKHVPQDEETIYVNPLTDMRTYRFLDAVMNWEPVHTRWDKSERPPDEYGEKPANTKFRMLHPDFMRYLKLNWLNSTHAYQEKGRNFRPTTGATMLLTALHTCDVTNAYGFVTADHKNYNNHYYESEWEGVEFVYNHDLQLEIERWDKLDKAGILNLYRGKYRYRLKSRESVSISNVEQEKKLIDKVRKNKKFS